METRQQRIIRELVDGPSEATDTSLQRQARKHTDETYVPRTLTPHEWEAWYAENGVPPGHRPAAAEGSKERRGWRRFLSLLLPGPGS